MFCLHRLHWVHCNAERPGSPAQRSCCLRRGVPSAGPRWQGRPRMSVDPWGASHFREVRLTPALQQCQLPTASKARLRSLATGVSTDGPHALLSLSLSPQCHCMIGLLSVCRPPASAGAVRRAELRLRHHSRRPRAEVCISIPQSSESLRAPKACMPGWVAARVQGLPASTSIFSRTVGG